MGLGAVAEFGGLGIDVDRLEQRTRPLLRPCLDWSERRYHLAGSLGAALTRTMLERRWITTREASRIVTVTNAGQAGLGNGSASTWPDSGDRLDRASAPLAPRRCSAHRPSPEDHCSSWGRTDSRGMAEPLDYREYFCPCFPGVQVFVIKVSRRCCAAGSGASRAGLASASERPTPKVALSKAIAASRRRRKSASPSRVSSTRCNRRFAGSRRRVTSPAGIPIAFQARWLAWPPGPRPPPRVRADWRVDHFFQRDQHQPDRQRSARLGQRLVEGHRPTAPSQTCEVQTKRLVRGTGHERRVALLYSSLNHLISDALMSNDYGGA